MIYGIRESSGINKHGQNLGWKMRQMYGKRIKGIGLDLGRIYWIEGIKNELGIGIEPGSKLGLHIVGRFYDFLISLCNSVYSRINICEVLKKS